jgi:hypothetical protein
MSSILRWSWLLLLLLAGLLTGGCRTLSMTVRAEVRPQRPALSPGSPASLRLVDVTAASGVRFLHHTGAFGRKWFPETNGSGAAIFDYDGDGSPDLFLVNGRDWSSTERKAAHQPPGPQPCPTPSRLFHNRGDGTFEDVTQNSGLDVPMYGMGCAVGDYNNDGYPDLYVTGVGRGWLFRNEGGGAASWREGRATAVPPLGPVAGREPWAGPRGRFREIAGPAGVQGEGWGSGCAWVDFDRDGRLDLFVCHYVRWDPKGDAPCDGANGKPVYCGPNLYRPEPCRLYHGNADGTFTDVSKRAGIWGSAGRPLTSKALGVTICDIDRDGWPDLAVANDTEANFLFRNNHDGTFSEQGLTRGMALPEEGLARSGMGIDAADWDGSGRESFLIGNFWGEGQALYEPDEKGLYADRAPAVGLYEASRSFTTFGCLFTDLNNDGWLDVAAVNGHIDDKMERGSPVPLAQPPLFLMNQGGKGFHPAHLYDRALVGRGLAAGDWNGDGAIDLLLTTNGGAPLLLQNAGVRGQSLRLVLEGTRSNRSGIGTELVAHAGGRVLHRRVRSGSSYLCASELPVTLGLGTARQADRIIVRWPSGSVDRLSGLATENEYQVREGAGVVRVKRLARR